MTELKKKYIAYYNKEISEEEFKKCNTLAYREFFNSAKIKDKYGEFHMILSELYQNGYKDIVNCIRELGFENFYITDGFSSLIERLGTLPEYCKICGLEKICTGTDYSEISEEIPKYEYALYITIEENK